MYVTKQEQQAKILSKIEAMVEAWYNGDIKQSQKEYEYIRGFCESANYDFTKTIEDGIKKLLNRCVGVQDTLKYNNYLNGV